MNDKLMYIPIGNKQNYSICRLKFMVGKFGHKQFGTKLSKFSKMPKVFESTNEKTGLLIFGYQCNLQSNVPSLPWLFEGQVYKYCVWRGFVLNNALMLASCVHMVLPGGEKRGKGGGGFVNKIFSFSGFLNNKDYDAIHIIK